MNKIDLDSCAELHASIETLDFLQKIGQLSGVMAHIMGSNAILVGCKPVALGSSIVSAGYVVVNGEIMPFTGSNTMSPNNDYVIVKERITDKGGDRVYVNRVLEHCASSESNLRLSSFSNQTLQMISDAITGVVNRLNQQEASTNSHVLSSTNPHKVTAAQVGLGAVDNTADVNKPISTLVKKEIDKHATSLQTHTANKANPHKVTAAQVGLGSAADNITKLITETQKVVYLDNTTTSVDLSTCCVLHAPTTIAKTVALPHPCPGVNKVRRWTEIFENNSNGNYTIYFGVEDYPFGYNHNNDLLISTELKRVESSKSAPYITIPTGKKVVIEVTAIGVNKRIIQAHSATSITL